MKIPSFMNIPVIQIGLIIFLIESLKIMKDQFTDRSRGFGFIEMANDEDAKKAIEVLDGKDFMGKSLKVNEAKPQQKRGGFQKRSSGYGGGRGTGRGWR